MSRKRRLSSLGISSLLSMADRSGNAWLRLSPDARPLALPRGMMAALNPFVGLESPRPKALAIANCVARGVDSLTWPAMAKRVGLAHHLFSPTSWILAAGVASMLFSVRYI